MPVNAPEHRFAFDQKGLEGWTTVSGQWAVEELAGARSGMKVLMQRATRNPFNVIVAPAGPFTDVDATMRFYPISGHENASGGIVFRFADGKYYGRTGPAAYDPLLRKALGASEKEVIVGFLYLGNVATAGAEKAPDSAGVVVEWNGERTDSTVPSR